MEPLQIIPKYRLLLTYDILADTHERYLRFMLGEFVPEAQKIGLHMHMAWHITYGDYPIRQIEFIADDSVDIYTALSSEEWLELEQKLIPFITNYTRKLVRYRRGFQV